MKKIYCVKLMNNFNGSSHQERTYIAVRFKEGEEEQELLPLIKQALEGFKFHQAIESLSSHMQPTMVAPGGYYDSQRLAAVTGRTVAFEIPGADVVSINLHVVEALECTDLFSLVSVVQESYLAELLATKACEPGDPLAEGNAVFMSIDADAELRKQHSVVLDTASLGSTMYSMPAPGTKGPGFTHGHFATAMTNQMYSSQPEVPEAREQLMPLQTFLNDYSEQLHTALIDNGFSKARATNQLNRLTIEIPNVKRIADKVISESGHAATIMVDGETKAVPYTGVDFNK
jgi:hypothetical protein